MRMGRTWVTAWAFVLAIATYGVLVPADRAGAAARQEEREGAGPAGKAARRQWALRKMDEMANERLRCRERFKVRRQAEECEADYTRRFRGYNEIYMEASRE